MKFKPLTKEQLIISIDRLTRFKEPETKYLRVFFDIIVNNLIQPKFRKHELEELNYEQIVDVAQKIINGSIPDCTNDFAINQQLYDYENSIFCLNENAQKLLKNKINYKGLIELIPDNAPNNLKWLKSLVENKNFENNYGYPVKKVLLCEGITEETLLPVFAEICGFNLNEHGIHVISAGGKNQVVKYFYKFAECLKIPIFVLLDNDAQTNLEEIKPKLRSIDKIHLLKSGEFEDLLPNSLITKALNDATKNISIAPIDGLECATSKVEFLEEFFKHRGLHEFKKAEFAQLVKQNVSGFSDVSEEIKEIILELSKNNLPTKKA